MSESSSQATSPQAAPGAERTSDRGVSPDAATRMVQNSALAGAVPAAADKQAGTLAPDALDGAAKGALNPAAPAPAAAANATKKKVDLQSEASDEDEVASEAAAETASDLAAAADTTNEGLQLAAGLADPAQAEAGLPARAEIGKASGIGGDGSNAVLYGLLGAAVIGGGIAIATSGGGSEPAPPPPPPPPPPPFMLNAGQAESAAAAGNSVDGVADFINSQITRLALAINGDAEVALVDPAARAEARAAFEALMAGADAMTTITALGLIEDVVVANRVAIAQNFVQIFAVLDMPITLEDILAVAAGIQADVEMDLARMGLDMTSEAALGLVQAVQTNGRIVEALVNLANEQFDLGLEVGMFMGPEVPANPTLDQLLAIAVQSVAAVAALAVPSVGAVLDVIFVADDAQVEGVMTVGNNVDAVADFIDSQITRLASTINPEAQIATVDAEARAAARMAFEGLMTGARTADTVEALGLIEDVVVANRVAIANNFWQIFQVLETPITLAAIFEVAGEIAAQVQMDLDRPAFDSNTEAALSVVQAVQTNGRIVEALVNLANEQFGLGLDVGMFMGPEVPANPTFDELLAIAAQSVAAVAQLAVPSVIAVFDAVFMLDADQAEGVATVFESVDGVADFINAEITRLASTINPEAEVATVNRLERAEALVAISNLQIGASTAATVAALGEIEDVVIANRVAIALNFEQIFAVLDTPITLAMILEVAEFIEQQVDASLARSLFDSNSEAALSLVKAVQTNGLIVETLVNIANEQFGLGLEVGSFMGPEVPMSPTFSELLDIANQSVAAVGALAVPAVAAVFDALENADMDMAPDRELTPEVGMGPDMDMGGDAPDVSGGLIGIVNAALGLVGGLLGGLLGGPRSENLLLAQDDVIRLEADDMNLAFDDAANDAVVIEAPVMQIALAAEAFA